MHLKDKNGRAIYPLNVVKNHNGVIGIVKKSIFGLLVEVESKDRLPSKFHLDESLASQWELVYSVENDIGIKELT